MKIYQIEADQTVLREMVQKRDALGFAIGALIKSGSEPAFFHDFALAA